MNNENVLTVIEDGNVIHIGDPMLFDSDLLVEYCRRGCKIETFTIDEFNLSGWKLYEPVPAAKEYWEWQGWVTEKPDFKENCIIITASFYADQWSYSMFTTDLVDGVNDKDESAFYVGLFSDGDEWGDIADLSADKYLVLPALPSPPNK